MNKSCERCNIELKEHNKLFHIVHYYIGKDDKMANYLTISNYKMYSALICLCLLFLSNITAFQPHSPLELGNSTCLKDDTGRCCPPVSACGGSEAFCNGTCPNWGD